MEAEVTYDLVVIGSGASGGWVAKEAAERGVRVLMLEAGRQLDARADFDAERGKMGSRVSIATRLAAILRGQGVQARCMSFTPLTRHLFINDRQNPYGTAPGARFNWYRARQVGGRLHLWGRNALRMSDLDFKAAEIDGFGVTWPIGYSDLEDWYLQVERFLGVRGSVAGIPNLPDGLFRGPHPLTEAERELLKRMSEQWPNRPATTCRIIEHMGTDRVPPTLKAAEATGRFELRSGAVVEKIETDPNTGLASGVTFAVSDTRERKTVSARRIAVAASTIESVRLLLNSAGGRHPEGLGNSSGNLGRFLADHVMVFRAGSLDGIERAPETSDPFDFGAQSGIYVPSFRNRGTVENCGFLRGYSLLGSLGRIEPGWFFLAIGEALAREENRVTLDTTRRDAWGIPTAHIRMEYGENERAMIADMKSTLADLASTFGLRDDLLGKESLISRIAYKLAGRLVYTEDGALVPGSSIHETGGARMGTDASASVVDTRLRLHDAPNVYVTDSAVFPTNPFHNPGLTIMALSARAGADIAESLRDR